MATLIPFQMAIRPEIRAVHGNVDYQKFEKLLRRIDELLLKSGVERNFVARSVERYRGQATKDGIELRDGHVKRHQQNALRALRCTVLVCLLGESYRGMSRRLAECPLYRWFCHVENMGPTIRVPGKSTLQDYAQWIPSAEMREIVGSLLQSASDGKTGLELAKDVELEQVWLDSTALKANMHFPVDWVLLRDAVRTLIKAIMLVRKHGLKSRMPKPEGFLREMNRLSIEMTHSRRKADSMRQRKKTLRRMKKMVRVVEAHAKRYRQLLDQEWGNTDWTRKQAAQVLRRLDGILEHLPRAVKQAHERIIGGRKVKNEQKLLSLYEREARVIVRGKAGAEVEFGNKLLLAEQSDGLIVDWNLYQERVPADVRVFQESIERVENLTQARIQAATADRAFDSAANVSFLKDRKIFNGICPKAPQELKKRQRQRRFVILQNRRAVTEGRIGIFKNVFCGSPMRVKGFARRDIAIAWRVLTHNLWVLARLPRADQEKSALAA